MEASSEGGSLNSTLQKPIEIAFIVKNKKDFDKVSVHPRNY